MKNKYDSETYDLWITAIHKAEARRKEYITKADKIVDLYRDKRSSADFDYKYNILYSNTETILPVVYNDRPIANVYARDRANLVDRKSAELIEDTINYFIKTSDFNEVSRLAVLDFLISGYGIVRPVYKPIMQKVEEVVESFAEIEKGDKVKNNDETGEITKTYDDVIFEAINFEYVYWKDFLFSDANTWEQVDFIAFCSYLTKEEVAEKFGKKQAEKMFYEPVRTDRAENGVDVEDKEECKKKAKIYEIWDKASRQQIFMNENLEKEILEINDDPLNLEDFFPIPKPLFSILTSGTCYPIPFYITYQDQHRELNEVCGRIAHLVDNMRRRGCYNAEFIELADLVSGGDNVFIPINKWDEFSGKGGIGGAMQSEDISSFVNVLAVLSERKNQLLQEIYELVGIADIRRGASDPRETYGAQKMKGKYGTIRISTYQRKVAEYFAGIIKICGEIIINQFDNETIAMITNKPMEDDVVNTADGDVEVKQVGVVSLMNDLREKYPSSIVVDIETDSTSLEDVDEKADLIELTGALSSLVERA